MGVQKCIYRRVNIFIRPTDVAPKPGRDQVVVDGVALQCRRIRDVRLVQADALHGGHEFLANAFRV